jgi:hypothetical protein
MDAAENSPADGNATRVAWPVDAKSKHRNKRRTATRPQLLTRDQLDGRTNAAKTFDRLVSAIEVDLGGRDQLSTIESLLIEALVGAAITLHHLNAKLALGEKIDLSEHYQTSNALVRIASRLGLSRRAKEIVEPPSLADILAEHEAAQAPP